MDSRKVATFGGNMEVCKYQLVITEILWCSVCMLLKLCEQWRTCCLWSSIENVAPTTALPLLLVTTGSGGSSTRDANEPHKINYIERRKHTITIWNIEIRERRILPKWTDSCLNQGSQLARGDVGSGIAHRRVWNYSTYTQEVTW